MATSKSSTEAPVAAKQVSWTIMLYISADGNIANFGIESLKQLLKSVLAPGDRGKDAANVVVAAQFAIDSPGGQSIPRYLFNADSGATLASNLAATWNAPLHTTDQESLSSFLKWVFDNEEQPTDRYALILWGHGPELFMQPPSSQDFSNTGGAASDTNNDLYLSPPELRAALDEGLQGRKLDIIGFDACSLSMVEVAYEVRDFARYMVASQEEVPDPSFPYDTLVGLFRSMGNDEEKLLFNAVNAYVAAYQEYVADSVTGMKKATLSALRLNRCGAIEAAMHELSRALYDARHEVGIRAQLLQARESTRGFVCGLYVDIFGLAQNLISILSVGQAGAVLNQSRSPDKQKAEDDLIVHKKAIKSACQKILAALAIDESYQQKDLLLLANSSEDSDCNGVSIYFPLSGDDDLGSIGQPSVKGNIGTFGGKQFSAVLNAATPGALMNARRQLILDTESSYGDLRFSMATGWYRFLAMQWARILVEMMPRDLDLRYSAQQAAVNACRSCVPLKDRSWPEACQKALNAESPPKPK